jgi:predicted acylesterase/phospholipase RssA
MCDHPPSYQEATTADPRELQSSVQPIDREKFVLSIDGGNLHGLPCLFVLKTLLENLQLAAETQSALIRPCEIFDMICGTSTGGIIAILLGRLGLTCDEAINEYTSLMKALLDLKTSDGKTIPEDKIKQDILDGRCLPMDRFDEELKRIVSEYTGAPDTAMEIQKSKSGTHPSLTTDTFVTVIPSVTPSGRDPYHIRSYSRKNRDQVEPSPIGHSWTIYEAARATIAHPYYIDPFMVGDTKYQDPGLSSFNNPTKLARREASLNYRKNEHEKPAIISVSLGTGIFDSVPLKQETSQATNTITNRWNNFFQRRRNITTEWDNFGSNNIITAAATERVHADLEKELNKCNKSPAYFRLNNPRLGYYMTSLPRPEDMTHVREVTKAWLDSDPDEMKQLEKILQRRYDQIQSVKSVL